MGFGSRGIGGNVDPATLDPRYYQPGKQVADTDIPAAIARDSEVNSAIAAETAARQTADDDHKDDRTYHAPPATVDDAGKVSTVNDAGEIEWRLGTGSVELDTEVKGPPDATDEKALSHLAIYKKFEEIKAFGETTTTPSQEEIPDAVLEGGHYALNTGKLIVANGYLYLAYSGTSKDLYVTRCNLTTKVWDAPVKVATSRMPDTDDHGNPGMFIDPDGSINIVFDSHGAITGGPTYIYARSDSPYDITSWSTSDTPGPRRGTYIGLHFLAPTTANPQGVYVFFRRRSASGSNQHKAAWVINYSTDRGANWTASSEVVYGEANQAVDETFYCYSQPRGAKLAIAASWHRCGDNPHIGIRRNCYYFEWDPETEALTDITGASLATPFRIATGELANASKVADFGVPFTDDRYPAETLVHPYLLINPDGDPVIYYGRQRASTFEIHVHTWNGTAWTDSTAVTANPVTLEGFNYRSGFLGLYQALTAVKTNAVTTYHLFACEPTTGDLVRYQSVDLAAWTKQETIYDISEYTKLWSEPIPVQNPTNDALVFFTNLNGEQDTGNGFVWGLSGFLNVPGGTTEGQGFPLHDGAAQDDAIAANTAAIATEVTARGTADTALRTDLDAHETATNNPHSVTYAQLPDKPDLSQQHDGAAQDVAIAKNTEDIAAIQQNVIQPRLITYNNPALITDNLVYGDIVTVDLTGTTTSDRLTLLLPELESTAIPMTITMQDIPTGSFNAGYLNVVAQGVMQICTQNGLTTDQTAQITEFDLEGSEIAIVRPVGSDKWMMRAQTLTVD